VQLAKDAENWMEYKTIGTRLRIKKHIVPHKFIDNSCKEKQTSQLSAAAKKQKLSALNSLGEKAIKTFFQDDPCTSHQHANADFTWSPANFEVTETLDGEVLFYVVEEPTKVSKSVQVSIQPRKKSQGINTDKVDVYSKCTSTESCLIFRPNDSDKELSAHSLSSACPKQVCLVHSEYNLRTVENQSKLYLGIPKDTYFLVHLLTNSVAVAYEHVLLSLKKIRLNDTNAALATDFCMPESHVHTIFNESVPKLAKYFKRLIFWPPATHIEEMLPAPFKCKYRKLQSILDYLEIEIQTLGLTWFNTKHGNTVKYLVSATPHGFINFVSRSYGGRTSDKAVLEGSGYLDCLPHNCQIMVDRRFKQISQILALKNCDAVTTPAVSQCAKEVREMADLRVHVEKAIRRLREFRMLRRDAAVINGELHLYDHIVIVACGIVNTRDLLVH
jgi:hypothetical protein